MWNILYRFYYLSWSIVGTQWNGHIYILINFDTGMYPLNLHLQQSILFTLPSISDSHWSDFYWYKLVLIFRVIYINEIRQKSLSWWHNSTLDTDRVHISHLSHRIIMVLKHNLIHLLISLPLWYNRTMSVMIVLLTNLLC